VGDRPEGVAQIDIKNKGLVKIAICAEGGGKKKTGGQIVCVRKRGGAKGRKKGREPRKKRGRLRKDWTQNDTLLEKGPGTK